MSAFRYGEGAGLLVAGDGLAVLLPGGDLATALAVHGKLGEGGRAAQVLQAIAGGSLGGLGGLPDFALVTWDDDAVHVVVRGPVEVRVSTADGETTVDGRDVVTWREQTVRGAVVCQIGTGGGELPLGTGVVRAAGAIMAAVDSALRPNEAVAVPVPDAVQAPATLPPAVVPADPEPPAGDPALPVADLPVAGRQDAEPPVPEPLLEAEPLLDAEPAAASGPPADAPAANEPAEAALISVVPSATVSGLTLVDGPFTAADPPARAVPAPSAEPGYDHLWEATQMRSVEDAAVRPDEEPDESAGGPPHPAADPADPVHDGETIGPAALAALRAARSGGVSGTPALPAPGGHGVLARVCLSGHSNPPERTQCWVCGRAVDGDASRRVRPPLGRIRLATGEVAELDASYVIGRRPKATRVSGEVPRVLAVPSPEGEVSGSHLAVRLEDWHVLATDQSRNGTILFRDGEDPRRLQPNVPMIMRSGDVLDLGDGAVLTFEGLP